MKTEKIDSTINGHHLKLFDFAIAGVLALAAAILYFGSMANYLFPGLSAHLVSSWSGLDPSTTTQYPLMKIFAGAFNYGNSFAVVTGAIAVAALYLLVAFVMRRSMSGEMFARISLRASRLGGIVASIVFMLTPAVREAATHLEPRLFDVAWLLLALLWIIPLSSCSKKLTGLYILAMSVMIGVGLTDTPIFGLALPLYLYLIWRAARVRGGNVYSNVLAFGILTLVTFLIVAPHAFGDFFDGLRALRAMLKEMMRPRNWMLVLLFSLVPFVSTLFASRKSFSEKNAWMQWIYHVAITIVAILTIASALSPSDLMRPYGILPIASVACVACVAGYLAIYWYLHAAQPALVVAQNHLGVSRLIAFITGGVFSVATVLALSLNLFSFDRNAGAFADRMAERILAELGDRTWFVSDGTLDDHLRIVAKRQNRELNLICLHRDLDQKYLKELRILAKEKNLGGKQNAELLFSLSLGVLSFFQDWMTLEPEAAKKVAIFGSPDLWYSAKIKPVPELFFFGADPARVPDWNKWNEIENDLSAGEGWGSYQLWKVEDPVERMRLDLRRHMGLVANNRGVWLQDEKKDDEAFAMYERVLNEIDSDNICALFNEYEFARQGNKKALDKMATLKRRLNEIKKDEARRYRLWTLGNYYGYIRSPEIFIRQGFMWARSGRPGEALQQIHRAIDFLPINKRTEFTNILAALYANENNVEKSREMYEAVLAKDDDNHDALIGLMRLELIDGHLDKAMEYLSKATANAANNPNLRVEVALLHMMRGDLDEAQKILTQVTHAKRDDLRAWSLLAAVIIQKIDATKDDKAREKLLKELENNILRTMEKQSAKALNFYVQTTRAFILLRKKEDCRREARDALISAQRERPSIDATSDLIMSLDISLNDIVDAERQAREVLRRNRRAPLANYIMGSLALQDGRIDEAETFLRRAADARNPVTLALNDLAEVLRRTKKFKDAERYARQATKADPNMYVAWETLASILLDSNGNLDEAEKCVRRAIELSRDKDGREKDVRMLITLARVQFARGDTVRAKQTLRKLNQRHSELSQHELREFEGLLKSAR